MGDGGWCRRMRMKACYHKNICTLCECRTLGVLSKFPASYLSDCHFRHIVVRTSYTYAIPQSEAKDLDTGRSGATSTPTSPALQMHTLLF